MQIFLAGGLHESANLTGAEIFVFELLVLWQQHPLRFLALQIFECVSATVSRARAGRGCPKQIGGNLVFRCQCALDTK